MYKKWDYQNVKEYIENEGYTLVSTEYNNMKEKLESICPNGHIYTFSFKNFANGRRCRQCNKIGSEQVVKRALDNGYKIISDLSKWNGGKETIDVKCINGHISSKRYDNLHQGCKVCQDNEKRNRFEDVKYSIEQCGYKLLSSSYINNSTELSVECQNGHIYNTTYSNFLLGNRCKECCHDEYRLSYEEVEQYVESRGYTLVSDGYRNNGEKLHLKCEKGHDYFTTLASFKTGCDCTICNMDKVSKGEDIIYNILENSSIDYVRQAKFDNCVDKRCLPFDFYIPSLNTVIEFDGIQHFKPKSRFGGEEGFIDTIYHDAIKNSYCEDNNINIIRIPYWELNNIENILKQHINLE